MPSDVLIVGAGPTGLLAACELLRRGVAVRIIDRAPGPSRDPKALSLWPRVREVLDDLGVGERVHRASAPVRTFRYFADRRPLASFAFSDEVAARQLPQPETERILTDRLDELGGKIERGVRLLALEDERDAVTALLEDSAGLLERYRAGYVIGADGASSTVRGQLGIGFRGVTYEMAFALIDTRIDGRLPADEIHYYQGANGTLVVVPQPARVFRFLSVLPPGSPEVSVPMMQRMIDERGPHGVRITEPVWQTVFRVHARHAEQFHRGRVFLAGDAAHVHSPAGGQGMNNGLQDAHNLAWKLAAVIHGQSPAGLLDSYGPERIEATRRIVRDTDLQTRAWMAKGPLRVSLRNAAFRAADRSGVVSRFYTPVMAGHRLRYTPVRPSQLPSGKAVCRVRAGLSGGPRVGGVLPRRLVRPAGLALAGGPPPGWTLLAAARDGDAWAAELRRLTRRWPALRVVGRTGAGLCGRDGFFLVRPDLHITAHGHRRDVDRLVTELLRVLLPGPDPARPQTRSSSTGNI